MGANAAPWWVEGRAEQGGRLAKERRVSAPTHTKGFRTPLLSFHT